MVPKAVLSRRRTCWEGGRLLFRATQQSHDVGFGVGTCCLRMQTTNSVLSHTSTLARGWGEALALAPISPTMPDTASSSWSALSEWEHDRIIVPMQARLRAFDAFFKFLGYTVQGEAILPVFASLYWCIDQHKCVAGIWLVPISEIANGIVRNRPLVSLQPMLFKLFGN